MGTWDLGTQGEGLGIGMQDVKYGGKGTQER